MAIKLISVLIIFLMTEKVTSSNPGVKARVTKKGIDYANQIAQASLNKDLAQLKIGDQSGSGDHITWELKNIQIRGMIPPSSLISLDPSHGGLEWTLTNLGISLHADWRVKYKKGWVKISDSGNIDANIKGARMSVSIRLGEDRNGRPSLSTAACNSQISDVDIKFHGGRAFIYNLFRKPLEKKIKDMLQPQICKLITKAVNIDGEARMAKLKVTVDVGKKFLLDYRLMAAPSSVGDHYLETMHKGEVYWKADQSEASISPSPIPPSQDSSKMLYLWITDYTANTLAIAAQSHDYLAHNLTVDDLPAGNRSLLNTSCQNTNCVGRLIPQIGKACPDAEVSMSIMSMSAPEVTITDQAVGLATQGNVDMYATKADGTTVFLLTLNMTVNLGIEASVQNERLIGQITTHSFKFGVVKSNVGKVNPRGINVVLGLAMEMSVLPKINELGQVGVALLVSGDVTLVNTSLSLVQGSLLVSSDVVFKKDGNSLMFESEHK